MTTPGRKRDLFMLVADLDMEQVMKALCRRHGDLGTRQFGVEIVRHPDRDSGCRARPLEYLRQPLGAFDRCVVIFDHSGCGSQEDRATIQQETERLLARNGWEDRAKVIVVEPELEAWVWGDVGALARCIAWRDDAQPLRKWLSDRRLWAREDRKPPDPKEAMRQAMRQVPGRRRPRLTGRLFLDIAQSANFDRCQDPAFRELVTTLQHWFPPVDSTMVGGQMESSQP